MVASGRGAMRKNPVQTQLIDLRSSDVRQRLVLELGVGRRLIYGPQIGARIEIQDDHTEIALEDHDGDVLGALRLSDRTGEKARFVTVGDDHTIVIRDIQGHAEVVMHGHEDQIRGLWELTGNRLVSWGEDNWLVVWNTHNGGVISSTRTHIRSPKHLHVAESGDFLCLAEFWKTRFLAPDGTLLGVLRWQWPFEPVTGARRLGSELWITQTSRGTKLWSSRRGLLCRIPRQFSLEDGYFHLRDDRVLIVDNEGRLELIDRNGTRIGTREADEALAEDLRRFIRSRRAVDEAIVARPELRYFEHRVSPICESAIPKAGPTTRATAEVRALCDFFDRPDFRRIRAWRREDIQHALAAREAVDAALHTHRTAGAVARAIALFTFGFFCAAIWALLKSTSTSGAISVGFVGVSSGCISAWMLARSSVMRAGERALAGLPREFDQLVSRIKTHRRDILNSAPHAETQALYSGAEVKRQIEHAVAGELREAAMRECGVWPFDLAPANRPIIVTDWSLLRSNHRESIAADHLQAFWWAEDGTFLFAAHFVQYVILGRDTIELVTLDYDFLARRAYNLTAHTIYCREITDVTKRETRRRVVLAGTEVSIDATEIVLVLRSGRRHAIVLPDPSVAGLRRAVSDKTRASIDEQRRNLEAARKAWERHSHLPDAVRAKELRALQVQLEALDAELPTASLPDLRHLLVESTTATIRSHLESHQRGASPNLDPPPPPS